MDSPVSRSGLRGRRRSRRGRTRSFFLFFWRIFVTNWIKNLKNTNLCWKKSFLKHWKTKKNFFDRIWRWHLDDIFDVMDCALFEFLKIVKSKVDSNSKKYFWNNFFFRNCCSIVKMFYFEKLKMKKKPSHKFSFCLFLGKLNGSFLHFHFLKISNFHKTKKLKIEKQKFKMHLNKQKLAKNRSKTKNISKIELF